MSIVLICGANLCGKSTLAHGLAEELGLEYAHGTKSVDGFRYYLREALKLPSNLVQDRFHLGEAVYTLLKGDDRPALEAWQQHMIERYLMTKGTVLIHCTTSLEFRIEKFKSRGEEFVNLNELETEAELFEAAVDRSFLSKIVYDLQVPGAKDQVLKWILTQDYQGKVSFFENYESCGQTDSELINGILVGDEYGDHSSVGSGKGVFSQAWGSSRHLHQALELLSDHGKNLYITNSLKYVDDEEKSLRVLEEELRSLVSTEMLGWPLNRIFRSVPVVALGRKASERLKRLGVPHKKTMHPQFEFRFKNHELERYANDIQEALKK